MDTTDKKKPTARNSLTVATRSQDADLGRSDAMKGAARFE